jgi:hypothetical protein
MDQMKNAMISSGIEPATFRLVAYASGNYAAEYPSLPSTSFNFLKLNLSI